VSVVERTTSRVIAILADQGTSVDEKRHRVQDVVYQSVDFETLSKLVLARNWSRFTEPQRAEFMTQFKEHLSMTYGRNVENYKNEKVTITGSREETQGDWTVKTKILRGGPGDILVDYRLRQRDGWHIIDVIIEGVSLVSNFRSRFQDVVASNGQEVDRAAARRTGRTAEERLSLAPSAPSGNDGAWARRESAATDSLVVVGFHGGRDRAQVRCGD
jgi:phospholipid transport system substrate-binding protein